MKMIDNESCDENKADRPHTSADSAESSDKWNPCPVKNCEITIAHA
jgi:hypothetical protein